MAVGFWPRQQASLFIDGAPLSANVYTVARNTMPAEVTAKINAVVAEWISPALQAREFRSPECIRVFELQRGKYNKDSRGEFTINLGVYHPSWVQATATIPRMEFVGPVTDRPAEQYCFLRERLDELAFAEADADEWDSNWWQVSRHVSVAELGESVMSAFENHALPWFDKYSKLEDAVAYLDREYIGKNNAWLEKISAMCGQALLGNLDRAGALYAAALKESVNRNEMQKEFADWRKAHGIVAPA